mgnify:CR=1 FL=1
MIKRVWKLGSLEHKLYPSQEAVLKLESNNERFEDIIWGPDIDVINLSGNSKKKIEQYVVNEILDDGDEVIIKAKRINQ